MDRTILAFERDEEGEWRVQLCCGHKRHLRHDPPRESRPELADPAAREAAIGRVIPCGRCVQRLLPDGATVYKSTPVFDEVSLPNGLKKEHSLKKGVWGRLNVLEGSIRFCEGELKRLVTPEDTWYVLPEMEHHVEILGPVKLKIDFFSIPSC